MRRTARTRSVRPSIARLLENLEPRLLLSTYTPSQVRAAYGINLISGDGTGQTIAIIDAYNDSHIANDLNAFDKQWSINGGASTLYTQYGAAASFLTVASFGTRGDSGWAMETSLDVEWAHAIAPGAKILLVQARSSNLSDLLNAVNYARNVASVSVVSMSWGSGEFSGETSFDSYFTTPAGHQGITFVASSGDSGKGVSWPSIASNVLSVGGTTLTLSGSSWSTETAWSGSGGGYSSYESTPAYQSAVDTTSHRSNPDVAYNASPNTGFYVYDSNYYGQGGWWNVGGTSAGAPQWAALVALADQARGSSFTTTQTLNALYALPASDFHDIVSGSNGFSATAGYDLVTGRGSPIANLLVPALAGASASGNAVVNSNTQTGNTGYNSPLNTRHIFQLTGYLSAAPTLPAVTPPSFAPRISLAFTFTSTPLAVISEPLASLRISAPLAQARIPDAVLPPSTDEILPAATPDTNIAPDELPAPAPYAQFQNDPAEQEPVA